MVGDQCVKMICAKDASTLLAVLGAMGGVPGGAKNPRQDFPDLEIVVHNEDGSGDGGFSVCGD